jgi:hypothetical protein
LSVHGDALSPSAETLIQSCSDPAILDEWLDRAFRGETSAQIFQ